MASCPTCRARSTPTTRCCCPTTTRSSATPSAARSTIESGTLKRFPNPPAMLRGEHSSPTPRATIESGTLKGFPNPPAMLRGEHSSPTPRAADGACVKGVRPGAPFVLLGLAFVLTLVLQKSFLVQSDEGYTLNAAWQMWNGMKMYDDFRLFVAPGAGCAVYVVWAMFGGPSFLSARILSLVLSFSAIVAVYLTLSRRGVRGATLATAVAAWTIASAQYVLLNHNTFSSYAGAWMLLALLRAQSRERAGEGRLRDHAVVGVAAGIVTLFLQTKGLALLAAASAVTLFAGRGRRGVRAAAALVGAAVAVIAPLLLVWRPSVLLREWFLVPLEGNYLGHTGASRALAVGSVLVVLAMAA